jgi:hypothetical protein
LLSYARSTVFGGWPVIPPSRYRLLVTPDQRVATDDELQRRDDLVWTNDRHDNATLRDDFARCIYGGAAAKDVLADIWRPARWPTLAVLVVGLMIAIRKDSRRRRAIRQGVRLRGREKVQADEFNARTPADGLRIWLGRGVLRK